MKLSALVVAHDEEQRIRSCLERLTFADEIVVVLDRCQDRTKEIAAEFTDRLIEGGWELEGERRNTGIEACSGDWILEIDADEHVPPELAEEIRRVISTSTEDWHKIPVDNYIGETRVRYGWGAYFGTGAFPRLFRKGVKKWGMQRIHPELCWSGREGDVLTQRVHHYVDRDISDMIRRLDSYSTARAKDLRESGDIGNLSSNVRRLFSRFVKCYVHRKGYREREYGLLIALCAGLYPLLSYLKAKLEKN